MQYHYIEELEEAGAAFNWSPVNVEKKQRVHILAMGDVGSTLLIGLVLLGSDLIEDIGIWDMNEKVAIRFEQEINQIAFPFEYNKLPRVEVIREDRLFDCDVFVFCASRGVPPVGENVGDVRMAQFEGNRPIIEKYAEFSVERGFKGLFAVVSDPVEPLCKAAVLKGVSPEQIQGYGLGVMNSRAAYYAKKDKRFAGFLTEGRAFGPHGSGLVIANSLTDYDDGVSRELTTLAAEANLRAREMGYKPYIAPALSSGAISLLLTISGEWHYSSVYLGNAEKGAFMGVRNRMGTNGIVIERVPLPNKLFERIKASYEDLCRII